MTKAWKYYILLIIGSMLSATDVLASDEIDNGTNANGDFIVSPTLALRCGITSSKPDITEDCIKLLAYDYYTETSPIYANYRQEKYNIIVEYYGPYQTKAIKQIIQADEYEDRTDKMVGKDPEAFLTGADPIISGDNDAREDMNYNAKITTDNASQILELTDLKSSLTNLDAIKDLLEIVVPEQAAKLTSQDLGITP